MSKEPAVARVADQGTPDDPSACADERYSQEEIEHFLDNLSGDDRARLVIAAYRFSVRTDADLTWLIQVATERLRKKGCKRGYPMLKGLLGMMKSAAYTSTRKRNRERKLTLVVANETLEELQISDGAHASPEDQQQVRSFTDSITDVNEQKFLVARLHGHALGEIPAVTGMTKGETEAARKRLRRLAERWGLADRRKTRKS
jgi:hypothetical protein